MHTPAVFAWAVVGLTLAAPAAAQRPYGGQGIPPGHLPPSGLCRVWYDNLPPGRQPAPTSCRNAEAIAARDRDARVIYGARAGSGPRYDDRYGRPGWRGPAFDNGYRDGYDQGRDDGRDRDRYDPTRHGRYRSGTHGYDRDDGPKERYKDIYRDGFARGYEAGYRDARGRDRWWDWRR